MGKKIEASALIGIANMLIDIANGAENCGCQTGNHRVATPRRPLGTGRIRVPNEPCVPVGHVCCAGPALGIGRAPWGVAEVPPVEDKNKRFGINIRVDEPVRSDFASRWAFERAHAKFDRLVEAAEAVDWKNKSNTAPLHKVNAIRRRIEDGPIMGLNLVGESSFFD